MTHREVILASYIVGSREDLVRHRTPPVCLPAGFLEDTNLEVSITTDIHYKRYCLYHGDCPWLCLQ